MGVTCIVEYWDALYRVFYRIFWKRNDDFFWICAGILVCVAGGGCIIVVSLVWGIVIDCFCWLREVVI